MMLCKHYNCYDINEVLKKVNLNQFCEYKREWQALSCHSLFLCVKALVTMTQTTDETMTKSRYYIMTENRSKMDFFMISKKYEVIL